MSNRPIILRVLKKYLEVSSYHPDQFFWKTDKNNEDTVYVTCFGKKSVRMITMQPSIEEKVAFTFHQLFFEFEQALKFLKAYHDKLGASLVESRPVFKFLEFCQAYFCNNFI